MPKQLTLVVSGVCRNAAELEALASLADRLKRHGRVEMTVSSLVGRTLADIPPGGSSWHDYTSWLPSLEKFFPHKDIAPFVDREHIARNRKLLTESLAVIRKHKMGAAFHFHAPWYLPEEFFTKYPHRRGPRIDHPRRGRREAFALCPDLAENQEIFADMFGQLAQEAPELSTVFIQTNDAGGGFCWADWLYSGPNGPVACHDIGVGQRVRGLIDAYRKGAPGRDVDFDLSGNFSDLERQAIKLHHDDHFNARSQGAYHPRHIHLFNRNNPVMGFFDPVALLVTLDRVREPQLTKIIIDVRANYERGSDQPEIVEKVIDLVDTFLAEPAYGVVGRAQFLRRLCAKWVGEEQADALLEAFYDFHAALEFRQHTVPFFTLNYGGVSMRYVNRPLVAIPERLSPEEEKYWLPHVFNPNLHEARVDYIDFHGGRLSAPEDADQGDNPRVIPIGDFYKRMNGIAGRLEKLTGENAALFRRMGMALRIYGSIIRSAGNFYAVQRVRDRHLDKFAGPPITPPKIASWTGDPDLQMFIEFMRDELDNTTQLLGMLENGGMKLMLTAKDPADEDTFLLGPDLVNQLKQKLAIMRRHWLDAEQYLSSPHK